MVDKEKKEDYDPGLAHMNNEIPDIPEIPPMPTGTSVKK